MGTAEWTLVGVSILALIGTAFGYLLSQRDLAKTEMIKINKEEADKFIKDLYLKYQSNQEEIGKLELQLAKNHYEKSEVTAMFSTFKDYLDEKFGELKASISEMSDRRGHPK